MKNNIFFTLFILFALLVQSGSAQEISCNMYKLPFERMIDESERIAFAEVIQVQSFWNEKQTMIYTHYQLRVMQSLKGNLAETITLVVEGGRARGIQVDYQDRIDLQVGAQAVIMLERIPKHWDCGYVPRNAYAAYASQQGVFVVDATTGLSYDPFKRFKSVSEMFEQIQAMTGKPATAPQPKNLPSATGSSAVAAVSSFSPTTVSAGTGTVLTITGTGFGATRGSGLVEFTNADGLFSQPMAKDYISWSDTQIQLYVPSFTQVAGLQKETACTGPIRVTPNGGVAATSPTSLIVKYSLFNRLNVALDSAVTLRMVNADLAGGYTFQYNNQFASFGVGAQAAFERAMSTWKCATQVNYKISSTTTTIRNTVYDNTNVITDDVQAPLPVGVLGRGMNISGLCGNGPLVKALTIEMDLIVTAASDVVWNFSSSTPSIVQIDFETVALHELGHLHQLAHTAIGSTNVMAPSVSHGLAKRSLTALDLEGAMDAMARSTAAAGCNFGSHVQATPTIAITSNVVFPACNLNAVTFTATTTNMTSNSTLNWFRNGVSVAQGSTYTLTSPVNNDVVLCQYSACTTIRSNSITVQVSNNSAAISYAASYCKSTTTAQSVTRTGAAGGTFSSAPAGLTLNTSTGAVTPSTSTAGTYTVTYIVPATGACAAFTTTATVVIEAAPFVTVTYSGAIGFATYCTSAVGAITPTVTTNGTVSFSSSPAGLSLNAATGAFTPSASTPNTYTITATATGTGACSGQVVTTAKTVVISAPLATPGAISGVPTALCGITRTFSIAAVAGASSYAWTVPAGATVSGASTGTSITLVFSNSFTTGTLSVRAISLAACSSALSSLTLQGAPAMPGAISHTQLTAFSGNASIAAVAGATSYTWSVAFGTITSGQGTTAITFSASIYPVNICVKANNACGSSASRCKTFTVTQSGAQQSEMLEDESWGAEKFVAPNIYPNPAEDHVSISFEESELKGNVVVDVLDAHGTLVHRSNYNSTHGSLLTLSLSDLPAGVYMLRMQSADDTIHTQRIIKQ